MASFDLFAIAEQTPDTTLDRIFDQESFQPASLFKNCLPLHPTRQTQAQMDIVKKRLQQYTD
jgi:hypothetical protein